MKDSTRFTVFHTRRLGGGSCSVVVRGQENATREGVAVKVVDLKALRRSRLAAESSDPRREVEILSAAGAPRHPNLLRLLGHWEEACAFYLVTDLCATSLAHYISRCGPEPRVAPRLMAETVLGLAQLEALAIVHRDVKPENLLLTAANHVKVADFGSAVWLKDVEQSGFAGSPEYASPEMLENSRAGGHATDVWSFGCVLFELYSGISPFRDCDTEPAMFEAIKSASFAFPPYIPPPVRDLVSRMLVSDPDARPGLSAVREHEYFDGIDWENLHEMCNITVLNADYTTYLERFLYQGEHVVHSGLVTKTHRLSTKTRMLVATSTPRLFYFDKETDTVKGSVPLDASTFATALDESQFRVHTPRRVYVFADMAGQANVWAGKINDVVKN
ncbi:3-phosphoinositide-dependent protein kinase 1 [Diplonema papillatum]|nr:3-phosphoinositide-dependent protein kinase 1 [Diplonema papillatum]|eukprot:gene8554-13218_t